MYMYMCVSTCHGCTCTPTYTSHLVEYLRAVVTAWRLSRWPVWSLALCRMVIWNVEKTCWWFTCVCYDVYFGKMLLSHVVILLLNYYYHIITCNKSDLHATIKVSRGDLIARRVVICAVNLGLTGQHVSDWQDKALISTPPSLHSSPLHTHTAHMFK